MSLEDKLEFKTVYTTNTAFSYAQNAQEKPYGLVFRNKTEFESLVDKLNLPLKLESRPFVVLEGAPKSKALRVFNKKYDADFSSEMVICAFQGQRTCGGYSIEITDIVEKDDKIIASAILVESSGGMTTQAVTYPAHFVACKKSDKPVEFVWSVKDTYAQELAASKRYMVLPKEIVCPPELLPSARTSRKERIKIIMAREEKIYAQLKKDCEQIGLPTNFRVLATVAFMDLEDAQVEELKKRGYDVHKST